MTEQHECKISLANCNGKAFDTCILIKPKEVLDSEVFGVCPHYIPKEVKQ